MTNKTPRLILRKHTYYIRVALPRWAWHLTKKKEIRYSLATKDYYTALTKLRIESVKIDLYFNFLKRLDMEIKGNKILLTDEELDKVLTYRLRIIDDFIDNNFRQIKQKKITFDDLGLFASKSLQEYNEKTYDPNVPDETTTNADDLDFIRYKIQTLLFDYFDWLADRPNATISLNKFVEEIHQNRGIFFQLTENEENSKHPAQMLNFYHDLLEIEDWAKKRLSSKLDKLRVLIDNPKISHLKYAMERQKHEELAMTPTTKTKWQDVYEDMIRPAKHSKNINISHLKTKFQCLETIFELIDKPYVEQINFDDCKKVNKLIYLVPKKWKERYPNQRLLDVLLPEDDTSNQAISASSIKKYITIFQEFLRYCRTQQLINADMSDILTKPIVNKHKNVWQPFEADELKKIFNPKTYFKRRRNNDNHKYWIPLISLYSGARLNEICQLRINDFKCEKNIDYFCITNDGEKQSVKNFASERRVPILPILKKLGLMEQVKFAKQQKQDRVFYSLKYTEKNKYAGSMSNAFRYYLDHTVEIKNPKKVFHSFRHTARTRFINNNVSEETVNILCGWEGVGAGAKNYLHREKVDIKKLYKSMEKLKYPEIENLLL